MLDLAYVLLAWFFTIQCLGGRYTFAEVPFPAAVTEWLGLARNPTDRIGHFFQGFVPALVAREIQSGRISKLLGVAISGTQQRHHGLPLLQLPAI